MAKIKHQSTIDFIDQSISYGANKKLIQIHTDQVIDGRKYIVQDKEIVYYGNFSYLGLEQHPKIIKATIEAIENEGIRLPSSRTYIQSNYYNELEGLLGQIYGGHVVIGPSLTVLHMAAIPVLFGNDDMVFIDQMAHASMVQAVQCTKAKGVTVKTLRHNRYDLLETYIKQYEHKHEKIWYIVDGIYSMYGDSTEIKELMPLLDLYPNFYLYVDDAHGSSWIGENGKGFILNQVELHQKMIVTQSLGKGFGVVGGALVTKSPELKRRIRTCGGTFIFSGQMSSATLGGAIASAKIHLSDEITIYQNDLMEKMKYCNKLIREYNLPSIHEANTPIFFIACGLLKIAYNMLAVLKQEGFLVNIAVYPAVSSKCSGIRFLMNCHIQKEDILALIKCIKKHFSNEIAKENYSYAELAKAFKKPEFELLSPKKFFLQKESFESSMKVEKFDSISQIDKDLWNSLMQHRGVYDANTMKILEDIYQGNAQPENNWKFLYYIVKDTNNKVVLATFFTVSLWKEDLLSPPSISKDLEEIRATEDPYYLTSMSITMGCQALEGEPLFVDFKHPNWKPAINVLLKDVWKEQEVVDAELIVIRDISTEKKSFINFFKDKGFIIAEMPDTHIIEDLAWDDVEDFIKNRSKSSRRNIRRHCQRKETWFDIETLTSVSDETLDYLYSLYLNVKHINYSVNTFDLPKKFFKLMFADENSEIFTITPNQNCPHGAKDKPISFCCSRIVDGIYHAMYLGMDYDCLHSHGIYRQTLYQVVLHAQKANCKSIHIGFSASIEKQRFGGIPKPVVALVQNKDNYKQTVINNMTIKKLERHY